MPKRKPQPLTTPKLPKSGTVARSLRVVGSFCRGPEHNDYYEVMSALHLALALMPDYARMRFDRLFAEFKKDDDLRQSNRMFNGIEDFVKRKPVVEISE